MKGESEVCVATNHQVKQKDNSKTNMSDALRISVMTVVVRSLGKVVTRFLDKRLCIMLSLDTQFNGWRVLEIMYFLLSYNLLKKIKVLWW